MFWRNATGSWAAAYSADALPNLTTQAQKKKERKGQGKKK